MSKISLKKKWVKTDAWRGYEQPINAVCGANDTGMWSDSPCPSNVCEKELKLASSLLRKHKIRFKRTLCNSSNVFCLKRFLVTESENVEKAKELIKTLIPNTKLLYTC